MKKMVWLVLAQSGVHMGNCVIGIGSSKRDAIADATGGESRMWRGHFAVQMVADEAAEQYPDFESDIILKAV